MKLLRFLIPSLLLVLAGTAHAAPADKYALANGCFTVGDKGPVYAKAAALGKYVLYTADGKYLNPGGPQDEPDGDSVWTANDDLSGFTGAGGAVLNGPITETTGCAAFPEAPTNATGKPARGASPFSDVTGFIDQHAHLMAFDFLGGNFHCGRPWSPLGITVALPDCASMQGGPQGTTAVIQNFLDYGDPAHPHDTVGWPTFNEWPSHEKLSYEQTYYKWIERAYLGGVRLIQTNMVENEQLCKLVPGTFTDCNDMSAVRRQTQAIFELQDYIDAQAGGPGKGWFRIVYTPWQARKIINQGKMAVVLGVELSRIFGCGLSFDVPQCNREDVAQRVADLRKTGIRVFYPVHKFDNAFGGTKMDGGALGVLVNLANKAETGHFWSIETCQTTAHDEEQYAGPPGPISDALGALVPSLGSLGSVPAYPAAPHCNKRGLTDLGAYLLQTMARDKYIIEIDHMSARASDEALDVLEQMQYPGVISSHSWDSEAEDNPRIHALGGMVSTGSKSVAGFISAWERDKQIAGTKYRYGFGFGGDTNGLAGQGSPRQDAAEKPLVYPFKSLDGKVTFDKQTTGSHTWDLNTDGVAHYGLIADWIHDVQQVGGPAITKDMMNAAESYLEMWERVEGVPGPACITKPVGRRGVGAVRLGMKSKRALMLAGQPASRPGLTFRWCGGTRALFSKGGRVILVGKTSAAGPISVIRVKGRTKVFRGAKPVAVTSIKKRTKVLAAMRKARL